MSSKPRFVGEKVKLGDVLQVVNGKNQKAVKDENGQYPIYGSGGQMGWASSYICPADTVIIGRKGNINKPIYVSEPFWNVDTAFGLVTKPELLDARYLYHFCKHYDFRKLNTTCTIPSLTRKNIEGILLRLPSIAGQKETAAQLDSILEQMALAQQEIAGLDSLVKSRFVEMFETGRYEERSLGELVEEMHIGPFGSAMKSDVFVAEGDASCVVYEQKHAIKHSIGLAWRYVDATKRAELKRFEAGPGTILVSCRGTLGKVYQLPKDAPIGVIHPSLMKVEIDESQLNGVYFTHLLETLFAEKEVQAKGSGVKMAIKAKDLAVTEIEYPPLALQQEFAAFVSQVDKSRFIAQQQIEKLQMLYDSLAQDYFGD